MTSRETERLAVVEERTKNIEAKLDALMNNFDKFVANSDTKFITRLEGKAAAWIIGIAFSALTIWATVKAN